MDQSHEGRLGFRVATSSNAQGQPNACVRSVQIHNDLVEAAGSGPSRVIATHSEPSFLELHAIF